MNYIVVQSVDLCEDPKQFRSLNGQSFKMYEDFGSIVSLMDVDIYSIEEFTESCNDEAIDINNSWIITITIGGY